MQDLPNGGGGRSKHWPRVLETLATPLPGQPPGNLRAQVGFLPPVKAGNRQGPRLMTPPRPDAEERVTKKDVQQLALKVEGVLTSHVDPSRSLKRTSRLGSGSLGTRSQSGVTGDFVRGCPFDGSLSASGGLSPSWKTFPAEAESHKAPPVPPPPLIQSPPHWSRTPRGSHQFLSLLSSSRLEPSKSATQYRGCPVSLSLADDNRCLCPQMLRGVVTSAGSGE